MKVQKNASFARAQRQVATGDSVTIPGLRLTGSQNAREHFQVRARRVKRERTLVYSYVSFYLARPAFPCTILLTRIGPRKLDSDNLQGSCKGTRDSVADWLGVDDGDETKVRWEYAQERGAYGVRIEVKGGIA